MSQENAKKFLAIVQQDPELQAKLDATTPDTVAADISALGLALGLDFTPEELSHAIATSDGQLDEACLSAVSGGVAHDEFLRRFREERDRRAGIIKPDGN